MYNIRKNHDFIFLNAKKITLITIILYVILKQLFFFIFVEIDYWLMRGIVNAVMLILIFLITSSKKLTNRQMSWMVPVSLSLLEITGTVLTGGDQMIYFIIVGCALLSLLFADVFGLAVTVIVTSVVTAVCLFLFKFAMLGEAYPFESNIYQYTAMVIANGIIYFIGRYTIWTIIKTQKEAGAAELIQLMFDTSPMCIQLWDRNLNTIECNKAAVELY